MVAMQVLFHDTDLGRATLDCLVLSDFRPGDGQGYRPGEVITLTLEPEEIHEPALAGIFERWSDDLLVVEVLTADLDGRSFLVLMSEEEHVLLEVADGTVGDAAEGSTDAEGGYGTS